MSVIKGQVYFAKLHEPSKAEKGFKSKYEVQIKVSEKDAKRLEAEGLKPKLKTGYFSAWCYGVDKNGNKRPPVKVVDAKKNELTPEEVANIGNGSEMNVQYSALPYDQMGNKGVLMYLQQAQLLKLVPKVKDEFGEEEGYSATSDIGDDDVPF